MTLLSQFQYSFCSYSTLEKREKKEREGEFQYSFCSYSTEILRLAMEIAVCFNTASVLIQQLPAIFIFWEFHCFNTASVLIQLYEDEVRFTPTEFQYSFCSYSTVNILTFFKSIHLFQYSFCSYSTKWNETKKDCFNCFNTASVLIQHLRRRSNTKRSLFQYSFCSYSTPLAFSAIACNLVSIQLLFLFNSPSANFLTYLFGFNTASVLIQLQSTKKGLMEHTVSIQLLFLFN